jgi:hypothetical protein
MNGGANEACSMGQCLCAPPAARNHVTYLAWLGRNNSDDCAESSRLRDCDGQFLGMGCHLLLFSFYCIFQAVLFS